MARRPVWQTWEWALLVDLVLRLEGEASDEEIEQIHLHLRAAGLRSEKLALRLAAIDPGYRSLDAVWAQYYLARRTRDRRQRYLAPQRLQTVWARFEEDSESARSAFIAPMLDEDEANPYGLNAPRSLQIFLTDLSALLGEAVQIIASLPISHASDDLVARHGEAWLDLQEQAPVPQMVEELNSPEIGPHLARVGLTSTQLNFKLAGWRAGLREFREARTAEALRRAFRWANLVLGSLGPALTGPGLEIFKEFKEGTEAVLDEAVPVSGFLPPLVPA